MLMAAGEAEKCKADALGTCTSLSPIYVTGNHRCFELFEKNYQVEILTNTVLPQAVSISEPFGQ